MTVGLFPGQGNQYTGMGKDLYNSYDLVKELYDSANTITGIDVKGISFEGSEEEQKDTLNLQLITYVHSCAVYGLLDKELHAKFNYFAGHSIGEYAALYAGGAFSFGKGVVIVKRRAALMKSISNFDGAPLIYLGDKKGELKKETVEDFCKKTNGELTLALYNAPGNYVVGGDPENIKKYYDQLPGARKIPLKVAGPFHTKHYQQIADEFRDFLKTMVFDDMKTDVWSNYIADTYIGSVGTIPASRDQLIEGLVCQLYNPVRWEQIIREIADESCLEPLFGIGGLNEEYTEDLFIEMGPGRSLAGMVKAITRDMNREVTVVSIQDLESLAKTKALGIGMHDVAEHTVAEDKSAESGTA